jgi:hypothetical protein
VDQHPISNARVQRRDAERLPLVDERDMRDPPAVEDAVDPLAFVSRSLRRAANPDSR